MEIMVDSTQRNTSKWDITPVNAPSAAQKYKKLRRAQRVATYAQSVSHCENAIFIYLLRGEVSKCIEFFSKLFKRKSSMYAAHTEMFFKINMRELKNKM
ncbi:MAG: hypothetical protein KAX04_02220 [Methanomicrobia archaeon]|nr:hypothetical protein [Methanomicrobia archaeon]